jgi:hypothetical protein
VFSKVNIALGRAAFLPRLPECRGTDCDDCSDSFELNTGIKFAGGLACLVSQRWQAFCLSIGHRIKTSKINGKQSMKMFSKRRRMAKGCNRRKGAAVVELAVCLPVILFIVLGSIEAASMLFLKQALIQSAYEGAKVAIRNEGNNADAISAIEAVAAGRRIDDLQIVLSPADVENAAQGSFIRVTVTAPGDANSLIPFGPFQGQFVTAEAVMVKE